MNGDDHAPDKSSVGDEARLWTVAVFGQSADQLYERLKVLDRAGFTNLRLFVEPKATVPAAWAHLPVTCLDPALDFAAQRLLAVAEQLMRNPDADAHLLVCGDALEHWNVKLATQVQTWLTTVEPGVVLLQDAGEKSDVLLLPTSVAKQVVADLCLLIQRARDQNQGDVRGLMEQWTRDRNVPVHVRRPHPSPAVASSLSGSGRRSAGSIKVSGRAVTTIVPTWNCGPWLERCLRSLIQQTVASTIVVVDDASSDNTSSILEKFEGLVTVIRHARRSGANAARNSGLGATDADLVAFADADNEYAPDWLERLLAAACSDPRIGVAYCGYNKVFENGWRSSMESIPWDVEELWMGNYIDMPSVVRRDALPAGGLREGFAPFDDWRLWLHMARAGWKGRWVPENLFDKHVRGSGKTLQSKSNPSKRAAEIAALRQEYADLAGLGEPLSVVVPACDCADLTMQCLSHLACYAGLPLSILYVDNGSKMSTVQDVSEHAERLGLALRIIRNSTNRGYTYAVNQGIRASESYAVLLLNNDCFIGPNCLENLARVMKRNDNVAAVGPLTGDSGKQSLTMPLRQTQANVDDSIRKHLLDPVACAQRINRNNVAVDEEVLSFFCCLLNRHALNRHGVLEQRFGSGLAADDEWCLRLRKRGWRVLLALNAYAVHLHKQSFQRLDIDRDALSRAAKKTLHAVLNDDD